MTSGNVYFRSASSFLSTVPNTRTILRLRKEETWPWAWSCCNLTSPAALLSLAPWAGPQGQEDLLTQNPHPIAFPWAFLKPRFSCQKCPQTLIFCLSEPFSGISIQRDLHSWCGHPWPQGCSGCPLNMGENQDTVKKSKVGCRPWPVAARCNI